MKTLADMFDDAESLGAGKVVTKFFENEGDETPFKVAVLLLDDPATNQRYLDALEREEAAINAAATTPGEPS